MATSGTGTGTLDPPHTILTDDETADFKGTSKSWIFTDFEVEKGAEFWNNIKQDCTRVVVGLETCPTTDRLHLQGFVTFKRNYRKAALIKLQPHAYFRKAISKDAAIYCMKEKVIINWDTRSPGQRNDLRLFMNDIKEKKRIRDLYEEHPVCMAKYESFYKRYKAVLNEYNGPRNIIWVYGPPGSGKSRTFHDNFTESTAAVSFKNSFLLGYSGEHNVIIDDFRADSVYFDEFLRLTDRYPHKANIKNGEVPWNARFIYITSPLPPKETFGSKYTEENLKQITRRLSAVFQLPEQQSYLNQYITGYIKEYIDSIRIEEIASEASPDNVTPYD